MDSFKIIAANSWWRKTKGLLGQKQLRRDQWLYLPGCRQVHTLGMRFAIDVIFVDKAGVVIGLVECLRPWRFSPRFALASGCFEGVSGSIKMLQISVGQMCPLRAKVSS